MFKSRFSRFFVVVSVVWFGYAFFLPRRWSTAQMSDELSNLQMRFQHCRDIAEARVHDQLGPSGLPYGNAEFQRAANSCANELEQDAAAVAEHHANAWKAVFPDHTILWAVALMVIPPAVAYGVLIGLGRLAVWVWYGSKAATL